MLIIIIIIIIFIIIFIIFNKTQKDFLNRIYEEGEKTEMKANPENVAKAMRKAKNEDNKRVFQLSYFLSPQQLQVDSCFSRMSKLAKNTVSI